MIYQPPPHKPVATQRPQATPHSAEIFFHPRFHKPASVQSTLTRRWWVRLAGWLLNAVLILAAAAVLCVAVMNAVFYPDCNRQTRDCFVVQQLWGQP